MRAADTESFVHALAQALSAPGPHLIEAMVPPSLAGLRLKLLPHIPGVTRVQIRLRRAGSAICGGNTTAVNFDRGGQRWRVL